jgi:hypothetical protein
MMIKHYDTDKALYELKYFLEMKSVLVDSGILQKESPDKTIDGVCGCPFCREGEVEYYQSVDGNCSFKCDCSCLSYED